MMNANTITLRHSMYGLALLGGLGYASLPVHLCVACGESMRPTLNHGAVFLLDRQYYMRHEVRKGDVVVFRRNGEPCVKRVLATAGDRVWVWSAGNGEGHRFELVRPLELQTLKKVQKSRVYRDTYRFKQLLIPTDSIFVVGDNDAVSEDSRDFGPVLTEQIEGRVLPESVPRKALANNFLVKAAAPAQRITRDATNRNSRVD